MSFMKYEVYRGEHGLAGNLLQTRLGSLSFGSCKAARVYANNPNVRGDIPQSPRIIRANITIKNPVINCPDDPFLEMATLIATLGYEQAKATAVRFENYVYDTDNWVSNFSNDYRNVGELILRKPELLVELYCLAYPVFDDYETVRLFKERGFDGAIHAGSGETLDEAEYKVFNKEQVLVLDVNSLLLLEQDESSFMESVSQKVEWDSALDL